MEQRETDNRLPFSMPVLVLLRSVEISTLPDVEGWKRGIVPPGGGAWGKDIEKEDSMEINVLGTAYKVNRYAYKDKPIFEKRSFDGYCDPVEKEIAIVDLTTHPDFEDESEEYCRKSEQMTLRHEIVHAFFNESGLMDSSLQYSGGWAKNEEMVDWIASQFNKIMECFKAAGCL